VQVEVPQKHGKKELGTVLLDVPNVDYLVSQFLYFSFDIGRANGILHVLEHYPIGAVLFRLVNV
jgi:hypothetical protein